MSCIKFVDESTFPAEWEKNKDSLLTFIETANMGVKGVVRYRDSKDPAPFAIVELRHNTRPIFANERGEFFRTVLDGSYEVRAKAFQLSEPSPWVKFDVFNVRGPTIVVVELPGIASGKKRGEMRATADDSHVY
jgi:hypothetical protein